MEDASLDDFLADADGETPGGASSAEPTDDGGTEVADDDAAAGERTGSAEATGRESDGSPPADGDAGGGGAGVTGSEGPPVDSATVERAAPTVEWSPDGVTCVDCDATVTRRWESASGPVCDDCKEW